MVQTSISFASAAPQQTVTEIDQSDGDGEVDDDNVEASDGDGEVDDDNVEASDGDGEVDDE